jgi:hypothetical protein
MTAIIRGIAVAIALCSLVLACSIPIAPPAATASRSADLGRVLDHLRQLDDYAAAMMNTATLGTVAKPRAARDDFTAMVAIAQSDLTWLASTGLPNNLQAPYAKLLSNIMLNASRLSDGSNDGYFVFLGTKLAPLWRNDLDKVRAIAVGIDR